MDIEVWKPKDNPKNLTIRGNTYGRAKEATIEDIEKELDKLSLAELEDVCAVHGGYS